ncbi:MAG TPA: beta-eliminating lyase-related protein, partial [Terriglobus sp.]
MKPNHVDAIQREAHMSHISTDNSQQFASDNYSGICPEAWAAMQEANHGHATAYGDDPWTARASD